MAIHSSQYYGVMASLGLQYLHMPRRVAPLIPSTEELLRGLGDRLRLARLRRGLSAKQVAARAGMAPMTLRSLERGGSAVTMGAYLAVMQVLGLEQDLNLVAQADRLGRELQDARLPRSGREEGTSASVRSAKREGAAGKAAFATVSREQLRKPLEDAKTWLDSSFASSRALANLIDTPTHQSRGKKR